MGTRCPSTKTKVLKRRPWLLKGRTLLWKRITCCWEKERQLSRKFPAIQLQISILSLYSKVNIKYQWSVSESYWEENMLKTISNLPNHFNLYTQKGFTIYVLDDYAVHLMPEIWKAYYQRGYVLVVMGGGKAGFIQANGTDLHRHLKGKYRSKEMELMLKKLEVDKNKVSSPSWENMVQMLLDSWKENEVHHLFVFKKLFVTNNFDGTEDYLVLKKLFKLIGDNMLEYCRQLLNLPVPKNLQSFMKQITPLKGIRRKNFERHEFHTWKQGIVWNCITTQCLWWSWNK